MKSPSWYTAKDWTLWGWLSHHVIWMQLTDKRCSYRRHKKRRFCLRHCSDTHPGGFQNQTCSENWKSSVKGVSKTKRQTWQILQSFFDVVADVNHKIESLKCKYLHHSAIFGATSHAVHQTGTLHYFLFTQNVFFLVGALNGCKAK